MANRSSLIRVPVKAVPVRACKRWRSGLLRWRTSVLIKKSSVWWRGWRSGGTILALWIEVLPTGRLTSSVLILVMWRSPVAWTLWRALIGIIKSIFVILFCRSSSLVYYCWLSPMVIILRWWRTPMPWKEIWRRKPVIKVTRWRSGERQRRTSVSREIKRWWWRTSESGRS